MTGVELAAGPTCAHPTEIVHAARQLVWHLRASRPLPAPAWLKPDEVELFARMAPPDQFEGLAVVATLESWGWGGDRELLLAALVHDAGKSLGPSSAVYRVLLTLLETTAPGLLPPLAARSLAVRALLDHPRAGADMAAAAGLSPDVVRLIAGHHQPASDDRMQALQRADALH